MAPDIVTPVTVRFNGADYRVTIQHPNELLDIIHIAPTPRSSRLYHAIADAATRRIVRHSDETFLRSCGIAPDLA